MLVSCRNPRPDWFWYRIMSASAVPEPQNTNLPCCPDPCVLTFNERKCGLSSIYRPICTGPVPVRCPIPCRQC
ncbi:uncharacterized protein B0H18DRAFT_986236 [Fomitopsis serialis]|uniref:uncharacterized protein n=1 Tax=Fomitopsis serialis TaxID=139415 RepID=UPI0020073F3B|nr:uncharacterized protein B0H18DRAFT_986236 [Neoantrodia serialis]KAH9932561.1 hypothetical protein B0H18DRAFT_986236 [Neoantrodia serialis]